MMQKLKAIVRDSLPAHLQVPLKYWYGAARGHLEAEMALLPALVCRGSRVADIGANRGIYAYCLHRLGAKVEVFEPNPCCADILRCWARHVIGVKVHSVALSSQAGIAMLNIPVDAQGLEHDASASIEQIGGSTNDIEVPLRSLDSFAFQDLEFIKIDVEGHESRVLVGAEQTLRASWPTLLIEVEQRHNPTRSISEIFGWLETCGYRGFFLLNGKLAPVAHFEVERHQSIEVFRSGQHTYCNNFLFLAAARLDRGDFQQLPHWMTT
jgi:FkbM family methyltransferase